MIVKERSDIMDRYYTYKQYLINKFNDKTYKLPIQIPVTCPNRDGTISHEGCYFCSEKGTGFEAYSSMVPISKQLEMAKEKVVKRYKAKKFIAYFQNYTNTYLPVNTLLTYLEEAAKENICGLDIATRPDCLTTDYLDSIKEFNNKHNLEITFEIGLQIANDKILDKVNRGHSVYDYVNSIKLIKSYGFPVCTHIILNLPETTMDDVYNTVKLMNELQIDIIKLHSLYIAKDSVYGKMYENDMIKISTQEDYIDRVVEFIIHLNPKSAISRLVSRIPKEDGIFSNWDQSWWKIYNEIINRLEEEQLTQGCRFKE